MICCGNLETAYLVHQSTHVRLTPQPCPCDGHLPSTPSTSGTRTSRRNCSPHTHSTHPSGSPPHLRGKAHRTTSPRHTSSPCRLHALHCSSTSRHEGRRSSQSGGLVCGKLSGRNHSHILRVRGGCNTCHLLIGSGVDDTARGNRSREVEGISASRLLRQKMGRRKKTAQQITGGVSFCHCTCYQGPCGKPQAMGQLPGLL